MSCGFQMVVSTPLIDLYLMMMVLVLIPLSLVDKMKTIVYWIRLMSSQNIYRTSDDETKFAP